MSAKSLYIHIPFCLEKCYYCNFVSFSGKKQTDIESYISSLVREIHQNLSAHQNTNIKSIYIGGGTPSLLDIAYLQQIFEEINNIANIVKDAEITVEANPGTLNYEYLDNLKSLGINRLSIGIQSFNDNILKILNRKHNAKEALEAVKIAKEAGFDNISIDLMYGLPTQTLEIWEETLNTAVDLDINHISAYGLKIEEDTRFAKNIPPDLPDEELAADMYLKTIDILTKNGFSHYEISNFAKPGYESRHNLNYWQNMEYFGCGLGAHGYIDGIRYSNLCNFQEYLKNPCKKASTHKVSQQEAIEEGIFLGLRLTQGINIEEFEKRYNFNILKTYKNIIEKYTSQGFMEIQNKNLKLTTEGILLSNTILADFLMLDI